MLLKFSIIKSYVIAVALLATIRNYELYIINFNSSIEYIFAFILFETFDFWKCKEMYLII